MRAALAEVARARRRPEEPQRGRHCREIEQNS